MRPDIDIDQSIHGTVREIAEMRYGNSSSEEMSRVYNEVLKKGLRHTVIPEAEPYQKGNLDNIHFIHTSKKTSSVHTMEIPVTTFNEYLSLNDKLYAVRCDRRFGGGMEFEQLKNKLQRISRHPDFHRRDATFGIRAPGGIWVGWRFGDCIEAITKPQDRYSETPFNELKPESLCLVFSVGKYFFVLTSGINHLQSYPDQEGELSRPRMKILTTSSFNQNNDIISSIIGELGWELKIAEMTLDGKRHSSTNEVIVIGPEDCIQYIQQSDGMIDRIKINNIFSDRKLPELPNSIRMPQHLIVSLSEKPQRENIDNIEFGITRSGVTELDGWRNISLQGTWREK
jgi:hypothetical protein